MDNPTKLLKPSSPSKREFVLRGEAFAAFKDTKSSEILVSGPTGTGKSSAMIVKLHYYCLTIPGLRCLMLRKTRKSLTESGLVTFEKIAGDYRRFFSQEQRKQRHSYDYPNGSTIVLGGMDDPIKVMSTDYDLIYCFPGETVVESSSPVEKAYRRLYSGPLVTIRTAIGHELTGTPNHPILTDHGWVALGSLHTGDYVISRSLGDGFSSRRPNIDQKPSSIADVFRALSLADSGLASAKRIVGKSMDFHGDGMNGEVCVVSADGGFHLGIESTVFEPLLHLNVSGTDFSETFFKRLGSANQHALRPSASANEVMGFLTESLDEFRVFEHSEFLGFSLGSAFESGAFEIGSDRLFANAEIGGDLFQRRPFPSDVSPDRIVDHFFRDIDFSAGCHVYNLQTGNGWYLANNIVAHNCQEAIELELDEWEPLNTRLRDGKLSFRQILADTNPSSPTHWLKQRCNKGTTKLYNSRHEDNPHLFDTATNAWTPMGEEYIKRLDENTSGVRKERLRYGRWVQAEGVIYDNWDSRVHLVNQFEIPRDWPRYVGVDFGFRDPYSVGWFAEDPDGRLYLYRELYQTGLLAQDVGRYIAFVSRHEPSPRWIVCDHDLGARKTIEQYIGRATIPADKRKTINQGIDMVRSRLVVQKDERPRLYIMRDCTVNLTRGSQMVPVFGRDRELVEQKKPTCFTEEIESYVWKDSTTKEQPEGGNDHSLDMCRYVVLKRDRTHNFSFEPTFIG
jgi:phage terminase large subunit